MRKYRKVRVLKYRKVLKQFCANFKWAKSRISGPEIVPPVLGQFPVENTGNLYYLASLQDYYKPVKSLIRTNTWMGGDCLDGELSGYK